MISSLLLFIFFVSLNSQEKKYTENSKINFLYEINSMENKAYLTFNSKWDFNDASEVSFIPLSFYKSLKQIDLSKDVKFRYYGCGLKPFRIINVQKFSRINPDISTGKDMCSNQSRLVASSKKKRSFISLSPLYEDITENISDFVVDNSLKPLFSQWSYVGMEGKREFLRDLHATGLFNNFLLMPLDNTLYKVSTRRHNNTEKISD